MADPIKIDLRDLTPEKLAECKPHFGDCRYSAPCVIGTLFTESERGQLKQKRTISALVLDGEVDVSREQREDAHRLQECFDRGVNWGGVEAIASKYIAEGKDG